MKRKRKKRLKQSDLSYYIGNVFIVVSVIGFLFIYLPIVQLYLFPINLKPVEAQQEDQFSIVIPKISANAKVIENVDPVNEEEYNKKLKEGIAHARGTKLPGEDGTIFLFAHSSASPWELTRQNTIFLRLGDLNQNDEITIAYNGKTYRYAVVEKKTVWPTDVSFLRDTAKNQLILQTCTPLGTSLQRLLVFADPV